MDENRAHKHNTGFIIIRVVNAKRKENACIINGRVRGGTGLRNYDGLDPIMEKRHKKKDRRVINDKSMKGGGGPSTVRSALVRLDYKHKARTRSRAHTKKKPTEET
jgi:hypothetical protein